MTDAGEGPWRTRTGRLITDADLDRWAAEAEGGYYMEEGRLVPERRAATFDGVAYEPGRTFRVTKPGLRLIGFVPHEHGGEIGWQQDLVPGDELTCLGYGPGWGSDPGYGIEFATDQSRAAHASHCDVHPQAGSAFSFRPPPGYMEPAEETGDN